jgi:hypothetical protein
MHDLVSELRRITLPRTSVNKGMDKGGTAPKASRPKRLRKHHPVHSSLMCAISAVTVPLAFMVK